MTLHPNNQRADRFRNVLRRYATDDTDKGRFIDLLTDARHWCDRNEKCFADLDRQAYQHYLAERSEEAANEGCVA